jgi:putative ABC transport system substrate-binding protein
MKKLWCGFVILLFVSGFISMSYGEQKKLRIFVVSSYHSEYLWSQDTHKGVCAGLLEFKFMDSQQQVDDYTKNDYAETPTLGIKKVWMDTKRKNKNEEIIAASVRIANEIKEFKPDLIMLGDDNATNYIGNQFVDTTIPVVFWGVDGTPMKYGLLDSIDHPGHNVTGVYQPGYYKESMEYLKKLLPDIKTFAILSDDSETGRAKAKVIAKRAEEGTFPLKLEETVLTNSFSEWQAATLRIQSKVDAFFIVNHNTLKDDKGDYVDPFKAGAWYLSNIKKPEATAEKQFVEEGMLITADDSGFKQGYEAMRMAHMILHEKKDPAGIPSIAPTRGAIIINRQRAEMLGIDLSQKNFIEEFVDKAMSLKKYPQ